MRCLSCKYDLSNLTEHRCPECGRAFDPTDPETFFIDRKTQLSPRALRLAIIGACTFVTALTLVITFFNKLVVRSTSHINRDGVIWLSMLAIAISALIFTSICILLILPDPFRASRHRR